MSSRKKRVAIAIIAAIPLAWIATGFADHSGWSTSGIATCLIAPSLFFVLNVRLPPALLQTSDPNPITGGLKGLAITGLTALGINVLYYAALCYAVLTLMASLRDATDDAPQATAPSPWWLSERNRRS